MQIFSKHSFIEQILISTEQIITQIIMSTAQLIYSRHNVHVRHKN